MIRLSRNRKIIWYGTLFSVLAAHAMARQRLEILRRTTPIAPARETILQPLAAERKCLP